MLAEKITQVINSVIRSAS